MSQLKGEINGMQKTEERRRLKTLSRAIEKLSRFLNPEGKMEIKKENGEKRKEKEFKSNLTRPAATRNTLY